MYNPNPKCESEIYYKFIALDVKWIKYDKPITVPENKKSIYVTFFNTPILQTETKVSIDIESLNYFSYSEKNTDLSLTYNGVSFNIDRQYKNDVWKYSVESSLTVENGGLIKVTMPDFTSYMFTRKNKYLYVDQVYGYELNVVYDDSDEYIVEYIVNIDGINYHYNTDGVLSKISNKSGNLFDFAYTDNCTVIKDAAGRATTLKYVNNRLTSITDANGGVINYYYEGGNLIKVQIHILSYKKNKLTIF